MRSVKSDGLLVLVAQLQLQSLQKERSEKTAFSCSPKSNSLNFMANF